MCCELVSVLFLRSMTECMVWPKGGMNKDTRCVVLWLVIYFSVVVVRMGSLMGESSGAKAPAVGRLM